MRSWDRPFLSAPPVPRHTSQSHPPVPQAPKLGEEARPVPPGARAAQPRARESCQPARGGGLSFSVETPPPNNPGRLNGENRPPAGHSRGGALNGRRRGCGGDHERQAIAGKAGSGFTAVRPVATPPRGSCPRQTERLGATPRDCVISQELIPHATRVTEQGGSRPRRPGRTGVRSDANGQRAQAHVTVLSFSARPERPGPRSGSMIADKRTRAALEQRQSHSGRRAHHRPQSVSDARRPAGWSSARSASSEWTRAHHARGFPLYGDPARQRPQPLRCGHTRTQSVRRHSREHRGATRQHADA